MEGFSPAKCARLLAVIEPARRAFKEELRRDRLIDTPTKVRQYLALTIGQLPHGVFMGLFLDAPYRLIEDVEIFRGTLTQTSVYPREVIKHPLQKNAAAVIFAQSRL
jgi:DNA repair protein RadC